MRNCSTKVWQMEGIVVDRQAGVAPLLRLLSTNIASTNVPRANIITAFARIVKD